MCLPVVLNTKNTGRLTCGVEVLEHDVCLPVVLNTKNAGRLTCSVEVK